MTPLRQRMLDAMTVRSLAERTNECYTEAVARLAPHPFAGVPVSGHCVIHGVPRQIHGRFAGGARIR